MSQSHLWRFVRGMTLDVLRMHQLQHTFSGARVLAYTSSVAWHGPLAKSQLLQAIRTFASEAANEAAQDAELNPLLQTPGPPSSRRADAGRQDASSSRVKLKRERDAKTAQAVQRAIPISPKKMAMWTDLMRRQHLDDAIVQCQMSPKKAARICLKARDFSCT